MASVVLLTTALMADPGGPFTGEQIVPEAAQQPQDDATPTLDGPLTDQSSDTDDPASDAAEASPQVTIVSPPAPPPPPSSAMPTGVWAALAQCESGGNPRTNTGNGYYGLYQEDMTFWRRYGGTAYAARPDLASPGAQLIVAQRGLAVQGPGAWPRCGPRVGLRR